MTLLELFAPTSADAFILGLFVGAAVLVFATMRR
jgi:hypothetical protein